MALTSIQPIVRRVDRAGTRPAGSSGRPGAERPRGGIAGSFMRRWLTAGMLLVAAILATLYIANAIAVDELLVDITSLERERDQARSENERLRAELLREMSVERITRAAVEKLGMVQPARPPVALRGAERRTEPSKRAAD